MTILADTSKPSYEQLVAMLADMKAQQAQRITFKITEPRLNEKTGKTSVGGGVSVYGLGQFPVTLYASQWERLIEAIPSLIAFMRANASRLTRKAK
jgi:hypothetical protein